MDKNQLTDVVELNAVPIFEAGQYPQGNFDTEFLQQLADNYDPAFHEAPLYLDHEDENGKRPAGGLAFGWIKNLYLKGRTLFANIVDVPRSFAELILAGRIKKRSIEIYNDLAGKSPYLRALAWPMIPQVKALADIHPTQIFDEKQTDSNFVTVSFNTQETDMAENTTKNMAEEKQNFVTDSELILKLNQAKQEIVDEFRKMLVEIEVKNFCEQMVLSGRMTPAERQTEQPILISQRQRELSKDFSENSEESLAVQRMEYYRNRKPILSFRSSEAKSTDEVKTDAENQKLIRYFYEHQDFFTRLNLTVDDLIEAERCTKLNINPLLG